jgi:hypothetical protein
MPVMIALPADFNFYTIGVGQPPLSIIKLTSSFRFVRQK